MTPLALKIAKQLTLPLRERDEYLSLFPLSDMMSDIHCFGLNEVMPLVEDIGDRFRLEGMDKRFAFLPAEKTWLEWSEMTSLQKTYHAALLEAEGDSEFWVTYFARIEQREGPSTFYISSLADDVHGPIGPQHGSFWFKKASSSQDAPLGISMSRVKLPLGLDLRSAMQRTEVVERMAGTGIYRPTPFQIYAALAIINTPRLIGRTQHMPHRGLERALLKSKGIIGKFPLHAWTEIKLSIADIGRQADGQSNQAHLTGEKCLHFCRSHLRVKNGRLERVTAHWRGNPAIGIKQSRYRLSA